MLHANLRGAAPAPGGSERRGTSDKTLAADRYTILKKQSSSDSVLQSSLENYHVQPLVHLTFPYLSVMGTEDISFKTILFSYSSYIAAYLSSFT